MGVSHKDMIRNDYISRGLGVVDIKDSERALATVIWPGDMVGQGGPDQGYPGAMS